MSLIKVANPRDTSEYGRLPARVNRGEAANTTATATTTTTTNITATNIEIGPQESQLFQQAQILSLEQLHQHQHQQQQEQEQARYLLPAAGAATPMFPGYGGEMSAMVSALTHVVSGQRSGEWGYIRPDLSGSVTVPFGGGGSVIQSANSPTSAYSSSSSGSWAGQKRGREQEETVSGYPEHVQRVYREFEDSRAGQSSSAKAG